MAKIRILPSGKTLNDPGEIAAYLGCRDIDFETWPMGAEIRALAEAGDPSEAAKAQLLDAFEDRIGAVMRAKGYRHADVVVLNPTTPGLEAMLAKFDKVHRHADDEVRMILDGEGIFGFSPEDGDDFLLEIRAGEYISVPAGAWHWFELTARRRIVAIRLFEDTAGWVPIYRDPPPATEGAR